MTALDVFDSCESTLRSKMMATWASMGLKVVLSSERRDPDAWSRQWSSCLKLLSRSAMIDLNT